MGVNFHAAYGFLLLGCIEIYIGTFLFIASFLIDKYEIRKNKVPEARALFFKLPLATKSLIIAAVALFVFSLILLILYLDLPESQSLKNTMTLPLVLLGASAFIYNSIIDSKKANDSARKSALINHLVANKAFYKNFIGTIFCGIFVIVGVITIFTK